MVPDVGPGEAGERITEAVRLSNQARLLPDACAVCGHEGGVVIEQEDGSFVCVDCLAKESGDADH